MSGTGLVVGDDSDGGRSGCYIGRPRQMGASEAYMEAVGMSHACREGHRGHGGVCRNWAAWRATGGGCGDRVCNPGAYGILTEA